MNKRSRPLKSSYQIKEEQVNFLREDIERNLEEYKKAINPIQDGGMGQSKKAPRTSFSPVTSTNVRFSPKKFLTLSFNPFATLV